MTLSVGVTSEPSDADLNEVTQLFAALDEPAAVEEALKDIGGVGALTSVLVNGVVAIEKGGKVKPRTLHRSALAAEALAELGKTEEFRDRLLEFNAQCALVKMCHLACSLVSGERSETSGDGTEEFHESVLEYGRHALRAVGNSAADHTENRKKLLDSDVLAGLHKCLSVPRLAPTALSVVTNLIIDTPAAQEQALRNDGLVASVFQAMHHPDTASLALNLLCNLMTTSDSPLSMTNAGILEHLARVVPTYEEKPAREASEESAQNEEEEESTPAEMAMELFTGFFEDENGIFQHDSEGLASKALRELGTLSETPDRPTVRRWAVRLYGTVCGGSDVPVNAETLGAVARFVQDPDVEMASGGLIVLGNLARNDEKCVAVMARVDLVAALVKHALSAELKIQHAALGCLKNLLIPVQNKQLGSTVPGLVAALCTALHSDYAMIKVHAAGAIRNFCLGGDENIREIMAADTVLDDLASMAKSENPHLTCGGARGLALMCCSADLDARRSLAQNEGCLVAVQRLGAQEHPQLKQESEQAMQCLVAVDEKLPERLAALSIQAAEAEANTADAATADAEPTTAEAGPTTAEAGPTTAEAGPTTADAGPSTSDAGPSTSDAGPSTSDAGPTTADAGPSTSDAGPTTADAGPTAAEAAVAGTNPPAASAKLAAEKARQ